MHYGSNETGHFSFVFFLFPFFPRCCFLFDSPVSKSRICARRDGVSTRMKFRVANSANRKANADSIRVLNRRDRVFVDI